MCSGRASEPFGRSPVARPPHARPRARSEPLEAVESRLQVLASLDSAPGSAKKLAVGELAARPLEGTGGLGVGLQSRPEEPFGFALVLREECAGVKRHCTCPVGAAALRPRLEDLQPGARRVRFACTDRSFDPIERAPEDRHRAGDFSAVPERLLRTTESQLQQCQRPVRELEDDPEPAGGGELTTFSCERPALVLGPRTAAITASMTSCCATRSCWPISRASWTPSFALAAAEGKRPAQSSVIARRARSCVTMLRAPLARALAAASWWARCATRSSPR